MSSSADHLVLMINQIARNLAYEPDPAGATAEHIRLYWDPRMKHAIGSAAPAALSPIARAAVAQLARASSAITPEQAGHPPGEDG